MRYIAERYWQLVEEVYNSEPSDCKRYNYGVVCDAETELYWFKKEAAQAFRRNE